MNSNGSLIGMIFLGMFILGVIVIAVAFFLLVIWFMWPKKK